MIAIGFQSLRLLTMLHLVELMWPASRLAAKGKARKSSRELPRKSTGLGPGMRSIYKILY